MEKEFTKKMKNKKVIAIIIYISLILNISPVFSATTNTTNKTPEPYAQEEFPSWIHDLRRAEIITLGAMPFITLNTSLCYSFGNYALHNFDANYFVSPFSKKSDNSSYSTDEQIGILLTSLGISLGIGITDFIVHSIKRSNAKKRLRIQEKGNIKIFPIEEDPNATKIITPYKKNDSDNEINLDSSIETQKINEDVLEVENETIEEVKINQETNIPLKKQKKAKKLYTTTDSIEKTTSDQSEN